MVIFVTGGAGFIGSNFLNSAMPKYPEHLFVNIDKLTYASNLNNLKKIQDAGNYLFIKACITKYESIDELFKKYKPDMVVHFAAESHVDRSIIGPKEFIQTNIIGTFNLLEACRNYWKDCTSKKFIHISTDEVYGSLGETGFFNEETAYDPSSPYSASKASSDHFVKAYYRTYGLPTIVTNCSNNYGPYQFPEKLIPLMIDNAINHRSLPVYGDGSNVRDWLYVEDHVDALLKVIEKGIEGESYNIGGSNEFSNIDVVNKICEVVAALRNANPEDYKNLITFVKDRPGHDQRYAIDPSKTIRKLGWSPKESFESGLLKTVQWYLNNQEWLNSVKSGKYRKWIEDNYHFRNN